MLILGILFIIFGLVVFRWVANAQNKSFFDRPRLFNNVVIVLALHSVWMLSFGFGLYFLWQVNSLIVFSLLGIYAVLWVLGYFINSDKSRAKKIFKIYRKLKLYRPELDDIETYKQTATLYFQSLQWGERRILMAVETIFEDKTPGNISIKDVVKSIFNFENPDTSFGSGFSFEKYLKKSAKEQEAIDKAYSQVIGETKQSTERPELSKFALEWIQSAGLNPDEMSNGQLQVFAEMDDHSKSNFVVKACYGIATASLFLAIFKLIMFDLWSVAIYLFLSFVLWFIGNKIQIRRISKKFHEASIEKYAQEKAQKSK